MGTASHSCTRRGLLTLDWKMTGWSFFNDTFQIRKVVSGQPVPVDMNFDNISWKVDKELYGNISAQNFNDLAPFRGGKAMQEEIWQTNQDSNNLQPLGALE